MTNFLKINYLKNVLLFAVAVFITLSCTNNLKEQTPKLYIEILNDSLYTYSNDLEKDTVNILKYRVLNLSNEKYYFYTVPFLRGESIKGIPTGNINFKIFSKDSNVNYFPSFRRKLDDEIEYDLFDLEKKEFYSKLLGYKNPVDYQLYDNGNFIIYPKQIIYFEYPMSIAHIQRNKFYDQRIYAEILKENKYYGKISIYSDSLNYKNRLTRDVLKTLDKNSIKIFNGEIKSINQVPIKVLNTK